MGQVLKITIPKDSGQDLSASSRWQATMWQALPKSLLRRLFGLQEHVSLEIAAGPDTVTFQIWTPYPAVSRVVYDITHKPPATIEWE